MVAQIAPSCQATEFQSGDPVVAQWSDEATGTITETFTKGTRKPVVWAKVCWQTGESAGKTTSHPVKQLRKVEASTPKRKKRATKTKSRSGSEFKVENIEPLPKAAPAEGVEKSKQEPETGDYIRGVTVDNEQVAGFVDSIGKSYVKFKDGKTCKMQSLEVVCRLPADLETYFGLVGVDRIEKFDALFGEYQIYNLANWRTIIREDDKKHFWDYNGWSIYFFRGSEVDLCKDEQTWYFELKRMPKLKGNGDIYNYCVEAIDHAEGIVAKLEAYERHITGDSGVTDTDQLEAAGTGSKTLPEPAAVEAMQDLKSMQKPNAHCFRAIDEEHHAALDGTSEEWVAGPKSFAVNDHNWKSLLEPGKPAEPEKAALTKPLPFAVGDRVYLEEHTNTGTVTSLEGENPDAVMVLFDHGHELSITARFLEAVDITNLPFNVGSQFRDKKGKVFTVVSADANAVVLNYKTGKSITSTNFTWQELSQKFTPVQTSETAITVVENPTDKQPNLEELANRINALDQEAAEAERVSLTAWQSALELRRQQGEALIQAKAQVKFGEWLSWLEQHCTVGSRQAQKYMQIANPDNWQKLTEKTNSDAFLTIDQAVKLLAEEKPPREKLPSVEEIRQLYAQIGRVERHPTPSLPHAFQVHNEAYGMPFPLYFRGVREATKWWQSKGEQMLLAVNRLEKPPTPQHSCKQCVHRKLIGDGSTWECEARGDGYEHSITRDVASEGGCRLFKAFAESVSAEAEIPVADQENKLETDLERQEVISVAQQTASASPLQQEPIAAEVDQVMQDGQTYAKDEQQYVVEEVGPVKPKVHLKLTPFGKQLDLSSVIAQIVVQSGHQTYELNCGDLILETE